MVARTGIKVQLGKFDVKEVYLQLVGAVMFLAGIGLIIISGEIYDGLDIGLAGRTSEFMLRAGFGVLLPVG